MEEPTPNLPPIQDGEIKCEPNDVNLGKKRMWIAYLLWLTFGWFGIHHLYLRRERQAFLWFAFFGGYFGAGWIRDLWWIPTYVRDANDDEKYMLKLENQMEKHKKKPPFSIGALLYEATVGQAFSLLVSSAIPIEELFGYQFARLVPYLLPFATALGVHTVGNLGRQKGGFSWPLFGAIAADVYMKFYMKTSNSSSTPWSSIVSAFLFEWRAKKWRSKMDYHKRHKFRVLIFIGCCFLYVSFIASFIYFNAEMTDKTGETIKLRDAISNFFDSPLWNEFVFSLGQVYNYAQVHGWRKIWEELVDKMDPQGEQNALKVLDLTPDATQEQITSSYRKLAKKWHPDRHKDPEEKAKAQEQFMIVQQAYELLSKIKQKRDGRNRRIEL